MLSDQNKTIVSAGANGAAPDAGGSQGAAAQGADGRDVTNVDAGGIGSAVNANADGEAGAGTAAGAASASSVVGDDAATDAGLSSLPPSEIGGHAPLDGAGGGSSLVGGMVGPPSPLTGCYLLIILGEPHSEEHKDNILQHLLKGFLSWDVSDCHVDLEEELRIVAQHAPEGEEARYGERLIQYASENLVTEVLIHPQYNTLIQCMRNLLSSFTRHRHIIHAGYTFSGNGSWILQDGTFSVSDFSEALQEHDVQRVMRAYSDTITMNIHCADSGLWHTLPHKSFSRACKLRINPVDVLETSSEGINAFLEYLSPMLVPTSLRELLETSDVVGNIRFTHPTLYVFPGGQGDSALFGINGFNMLVDGGFNRKACYWDFARHLDRLDAVLMTRLNNSNIQGLESVIKRKSDEPVYPQIGHFFCNIPDRKSGLPSPDGDKDRNPLLVDLFESGHNLVNNVKSLDLKPHSCYRNHEPINLYHKVGHGTLDMYVISPSRDSKEVKEFVQKWNAGDQRLFNARDSKEFNFPLQNLVSICALLVWQPANPEDTITRILFPGSTPDFKIQEGLEKIKHLDFMKHSTCTAKSIAPAMQTTRKSLKSTVGVGSIETVITSKVGKIPSSATQVIATPQQQDNKIKESVSHSDNNRQARKDEADKFSKVFGKEDSLDTDDKAGETGDETAVEHTDEADKAEDDKTDLEKVDGITENVEEEEQGDKEVVEKKIEIMIVKPQPQTGKDVEDIAEGQKKIYKSKSDKPRAEVKPVIRSRIDTKPPKSMDRKIIKKDLVTDKKSSPSASPKKQPAPQREVKPKVVSRISKTSPSSTPAKSTKDANNRKVLESKQHASRQSVVSTRREVSRNITTTTDKKEKNQQVQQRKPISRRPRGTSPSKRPPGSPVKSIRPKAELKKTGLDKGGTTDSSLVSTPSVDDTTGAKKIVDLTASQELDAEKQRELDDLKEEQEVVREIEAVFSRDEMKRQKQIKDDIREISKQDSTTEAEDEEEYLIIEREEIEQYTEDSNIEPENVLNNENEMQKHQRDSQESEKKRKLSGDLDESEKQSIDHRKITQLPIEEKSEIKAEVQDIITAAKQIAKSRSDEPVEHIGKQEDELSSPTPEEKISSAKKTSDTKDEPLDVQEVIPVNLQESLPEEKFSATIESGATTAPTLPEDERIPLDEIKEDIVEEKYTKEETKEKDIVDQVDLKNTEMEEPIEKASTKINTEIAAAERVLPMKMTFDIQQNLLRDVIKTPDEVADLPVHEEADLDIYQKDSQDGNKQSEQRDESVKIDKNAKESTAKEMEDKIATVDVTSTENIELEIKDDIDKDTVEESQTVNTINIVQSQIKEEQIQTEEKHKKLFISTDEKEISEMTSEDELPAANVHISASTLKVGERDETNSMESPATIEEAIEVDMHQAKEHTIGKRSIQESKIFLNQDEMAEIETVSSPIDKATFSTLTKDFIVREPGSTSKLPTVSSPVDVAMGEFKPYEPLEPLETINQTFNRAATASTPIDEAMENMSITDLGETSLTRAESPEFKVTVSERDEPILHDIKEEEEEHRLSPHFEQIPFIRPVSPREEEVIKIVADVAKVLKSEKDITEIIPSFNETEFEIQIGNLRQEKSVDLTDDSQILNRVKITPLEFVEPIGTSKHELDSEKSSPDQKSGPISIEEKDKIEESEKVLLKDSQIKVHTPDLDIRRESTVSIISEKDLTKEESTTDEKSATVISEQKEKQKDDSSLQFDLPDEEIRKGAITVIQSSSGASHMSKLEEIDILSIQKASMSPTETKEDEKTYSPPKDASRPDSVASHVSIKEEKESASRRESFVSKAETKKDDLTSAPPKDASRPDSAASHVSMKEEKAERPESAASHISGQEAQESVSRRESSISTTETKKDEQTCSPHKDASRPDSVASHTSGQEEKESASRRESSIPTMETKKGEQTSSPHKDASRPDSVASHVSMKEEKAERPESAASHISGQEAQESVSRRESLISTTETKKDEETSSPPKDASRPDSVASHTSGQEEKESASRRESSIPTMETKKGEQTSSPHKDASRPDSVASHVSMQEEKAKRPESAASHISEQEVLESVSRRESSISTTETKKDEQTFSPHKDASRPDSVASHTSGQEEKESASRRESSIPTMETKKGEQTSSPHKDASRPDSVASHVSMQEEKAKRPESAASHISEQEVLESVSRRESSISTTETKKDEQTFSPHKDASRPDSVASHTSGQEEKESASRRESSVSTTDTKKDEQTSSPHKDASRPDSVASHTSGQEGKESASRRESSVSTTDTKKDDLTSAPPKDASRPDSVASHVSMQEEKAKRPESAASHISEQKALESVSRRESSISTTETKKDEQTFSPHKDASRPDSVASHTSGQEEKESASRRESSVSTTDTKKDDLTSAPPKDASRPDSVASHVSMQEEKAKRPESAASHISEKEAPESVSRRESSILTTDTKKDDLTSTPPKDASRPDSVASHVSMQEEKSKRPESAASHISEQEALESVSRRESSISTTETKKDEETSSPPKDSSRPDSVASHVSMQEEKAKRPESAESHIIEQEVLESVSRRESSISTTETKKDEETSSPPKDASRPDSVASHVSMQEEKAKRPESAASHISEQEALESVSRRESSISTTETKKKEEGTSSPPKDASRPDSVASHVSMQEEKAKRPESAASHISEQEALESVSRRESSIPTTETKKDEQTSSPPKDASRPVSVASHVSIQEEKDDATFKDLSSDEQKKGRIPTPTKDSSRPQSVSSHISGQETQESVSRRESSISTTETKKDETSSSPKDASRPDSVASHVSMQEEKAKRPESAASHISEQEALESVSRRESSIPTTETKKDEQTSSPPKDASRPVSVASHVSMQEEKEDAAFKDLSSDEQKKRRISSPTKVASRPQSVSSHISEQETQESVSRRESSISTTETKKDEETSSPPKDSSRPDSVASHVSMQEEKAKRPESAASHISEQEALESVSRRESSISTTETKKKEEGTSSPPKDASRPDSVASHVSMQEEKAKRPESAESHIIEQEVLESVSRRESSISTTETKKKEEGTSSPPKDSSRPDSVASHVSMQEEKAKRPKSAASHISEQEALESVSRRESSISTTETKKQEEGTSSPPKNASRPDSVASHVSMQEEKAKRPESAESHIIEQEVLESVSRRESSISTTETKKKEEGTSSPPKDASRPDSVASHVSMQEEKAKRPESAESHIIEQEVLESVSRRESSISTTETKKDEQTSSPPKDASRPDSVASHVSMQEEKAKRPESAASHISEQEALESVSRRESSISTTETKKKEKGTSSPPKDASRPDSVASHVSMQEEKAKRPESAASHISEQEVLESVSRRESSISTTETKKDEDTSLPPKDASRPDSVASHVSMQEEKAKRPESAASHISEQEALESVSRRESSISTTETKKKEEGTSSPPKDASRPDSVASHVSMQEEKAKRPESAASHISEQEVLESVSRRESSISTTETKKDEETSSPPKDASRPDSVASHVSMQEEKAKRPESAASHISEQEVLESVSRRESSISTTETKKKEEETSSPPKDASRPDSVASHTSGQEEKESASRRESSVSTTDTKKDDLTSAQPKDASRPDSVASHVSMQEEKAKRPESAASHISGQEAQESVSRRESSISTTETKKKEEGTSSPPKDASRPDSVASHVSMQEEKAKRPESAASHIIEQEVLESVSRRESFISTTETKKKEEGTSSPPKDASRPDSVASHVSMQEEKAKRPESAASHIIEQEVLESVSRRESFISTTETKKEEGTSSPPKDSSRPDSVASHVSMQEEKAKRPESAASHISEQEVLESVSRRESFISPTETKKDEQTSSPPKDVSRPDSVASHVSMQEEKAKRPESAASHISEQEAQESVSRRESSISTTETKKDEEKSSPPKDSSRPDSVASHVSMQEEKAKRPESAASHISEQEALESVSRRESSISTTETKKDEETSSPPKDSSRPDSVASHVSMQEEKAKRPESAASHISEQEALESVSRRESSISTTETKKDEQTSSPPKDPSRPVSVASHVSIQEEKEDAAFKDLSSDEQKKGRIPTPTKVASRPQSVSSHISEQETQESVSRRESSISTTETKKDEESSSPPKDVSRTDSVASHVSMQEEKAKRPESAASHISEQEALESVSRRESSISTTETKKDEETSSPPKDASRPVSVASHVSIQEEKDDATFKDLSSDEQKKGRIPTPTKDSSRPLSVSSHISGQEAQESVSRRESSISTTETKKDEETSSPPKDSSRPDSVASHVSMQEEKAKRPESAASHISEQEALESVSRRESSITTMETKKDEETSSPPKDASRPVSVASHVSIREEKDDAAFKDLSSDEQKKGRIPTPTKDSSRPQSVSSHISGQEAQESVSRRESSITTMETKKDEETSSPPKDASRPDSVASHVSIQEEKEEALRESYTSTTETNKNNQTHISRPESVVSHISIQEEIENASHKKLPIATAEIKQDVQTSSLQKDVSRSESVASHVSIEAEIQKTEAKVQETSIAKNEIKTIEHISSSPKHTSRPQSAASHSSEEKKESSTTTTIPRDSLIKKDETVAKHISDEEEKEAVARLVSTMLTSEMEMRYPPTEPSSSIQHDLLLTSTEGKSYEKSSPISEKSNIIIEKDQDIRKESFYLTTDSKKDEGASTTSQMITRSESMTSHASSQESPQHAFSSTAHTKYISVQDEINAAMKQETRSKEMKKGNIPDDGEYQSSKDILKETVAEFIATEKVISCKEGSSMETVLKSAKQELVDASESNASKKSESGHEAAESDISESRHTHSDHEDEDKDFDILNIKEGRSKSIASVMMTSIYKPFEQMTGISTLPEQLLEETSSQSQDSRGKSATILLEKTKTSSQTDYSIYSSETDREGRKTPPTAPVSPGIKSTGVCTSTVLSATITGGSCTASLTGPLSPKDVSGKSSPGALTSESQSIPTPFGRESQTETPESSPKPTSPFPRVTKEELKGSSEQVSATGTSSYAAESEPSSEVISDLHEVRGIENATALSSSTEKIITTTITTVTKVISADGKETVTQEKTVTTTDTSEPDGEKVTVTTTRTTSESDKSDHMLPKEVTMLRGIYRSSTPGSDDERGPATYISDDDLPASPRSVASYDLQRSSSGVSKRSDYDVEDNHDDIPPQYGSDVHSTAHALPTSKNTIDPMSTSYYGTLPESFEKQTSKPIPIQGISEVHFATKHPDLHSLSSVSSDSTSQVASQLKNLSSDHKFLDEADKDFEKALKEHVELRGENVMSSVTAKYSYSPSKSEEIEQGDVEKSKSKFPLSDIQKVKSIDIHSTPTTEVSVALASTSSTTTVTITSDDEKSKSLLKEWGKPLGLPSPLPIFNEGDIRTTPKKERRLMTTKTRLNNEKNLRKRSESPSKTRKPSPVYVDLTYVPHNGNSYYSHLDFFKRVRARYYVFSGTEPSRQVYDALLEAKQTWEDKDLEVTIIPTYDTDVLGYWVAENEELLAKNRIDLSPSASRCTINLQDHETSCSAYRLEF